MKTSRVLSLGRAELLQFSRNKTLVIVSLIFGLGFPVGLYLIGATKTVGLGFEWFLVMALLYVQYYSVLSMVTTRRDEGVLKRLRAGEATDAEVLVAITLPGFSLAAVMSVVCAILFIIWSGEMPHNLLLVVLATVLGLVTSVGLALMTSAFTKNAEAAQITSMPVFILFFLGMSSFRPMLELLVPSENIRDSFTRLPFMSLFDAAAIGWDGQTQTGATNGWVSLAFAAVWAGFAVWSGLKYLKWETQRG